MMITGWDGNQHAGANGKKLIDFFIQKPFEVYQVLKVVQEGMR